MVEKERKKVGQLCPDTETGAVQVWPMTDSRDTCIRLINQSITALPGKTIPYQTIFPNRITPIPDILC